MKAGVNGVFRRASAVAAQLMPDPGGDKNGHPSFRK
jgi:hypothetical protein